MAKRPNLKAVTADASPPKVVDLVPAEATHHELAQAYLMEQELAAGRPPIGLGGAIYVGDPETCLWRPKSQDKISLEIGESYRAHKNAKTVSHYRAIAAHATTACDAPDFFADAPAGVACPSGFWSLEDGGLKCRKLTLDDRQRFALAFDPDFETEPVLTQKFLDHALDQPQQDLLWEAVGAVLMGLLARFQTVLALYGVPASGKSVIQRKIEKLFPASAVASVGPHRWSHEYYVAALAHARINLVGELPDDQSIPAASFKQVVGGDLLSGRDPAHRPSFFRCEAAHVFNLNHLPMIRDRSDGIYRRWRFIHFTRSVAPSERDPYLADKIIASEMGAVLALALQGAERAWRRGSLATTAAHDAVLARWRIASSPVLLFLTDTAYCELSGDDRDKTKRALVYAAYRRWAGENGNKPMSTQAFYGQIDDAAGGHGVYQKRQADGDYIVGVRLVAGTEQGALTWSK